MAGPTTVVIEQPVVTVVTAGMQGPPGPMWPWSIFKNSVGATETATVPVGYFILGISAFEIQGTLDNEGTLVVI